MRLTIIDRDYDQCGFPLVVEVFEVRTITPETFAWIAARAAAYRDADYLWLVSPAGVMPAHGVHNAWGQLSFSAA